MLYADATTARGKTAEASGLYQQALQIAETRSDPGQGSIDLSEYTSPTNPPTYALESDETSESVAQLPGYRLSSNDPGVPGQIRQSDEVVNAVRVLTRLYRLHDQTDQAIQLFQAKIQQGTAEGWSPVILAQFHKGLGDIYLAEGRLESATQAYQQAVALDNWWPEARLGLVEALSAQGDTAGAFQQLETAVDSARFRRSPGGAGKGLRPTR
jgi:tetratricopeptide (TPR) repeat protein